MADNQGSGCGVVLGILAVLIGVPLFILVIAISGGEEEELQASCRPGTTGTPRRSRRNTERLWIPRPLNRVSPWICWLRRSTPNHPGTPTL